MKKAKIMLTAITFLAVVGGALAFKANKFARITYYTTTASNPNSNTVCNIQTLARTTTGSSLTVWATTANGDAKCANITITTSPE